MGNRRKFLRAPGAGVLPATLVFLAQRPAKKRDRVGPQAHSTRRRALAVLAATSSALATPFVSFAQAPAKVWRIGVLHPGRKAAPTAQYTIFFEALRDLGYVEGKNLVVQWQFADFNLQRLPELAALLVKQNVDLIVTNGTPPVRALQSVTTTIPILDLSFDDPIGSGFAKSLSRPGGNITGIAILSSELAQRRVQMLAEIAPGASRIARLFNPDNPVDTRAPMRADDTARKLGREIVHLPVRNASELSATFDRVVRERAGALIVSEDAVLSSFASRIAELALQRKLPSMWGSSRGPALDGLVSYGWDFRQTARSAAMMAVKILKGTKPADIPIEQPTLFELVVNLKTAKTIGITIPPAIMVQATRVIE
jgi:putative ABC transport system substrate-binding protein